MRGTICGNPSEWIMIFIFYAKVSFFENLVKNLIAAGVVRKNIWFSVPAPQIKFDPPCTREKCFGVHILGL